MQQILLDGTERSLHHKSIEVFEKKTSPKVIVETKKMAPSCETTVESSEDKRLKIGIILLIILVGIMVVNTLLLFMNLQTLRSMISA